MRANPVVTGLGCISSLGCSVGTFTRGIVEGRSGIAPIAEFDTSKMAARQAARIAGFDPAAFIAPAKLRRIDAVGRVAIAATRLALEDGGLDPATAGNTAGLVLGTSTAGIHTTGEYLESLMNGGPTGAPALLFANTVGNSAASLCGLEFGLRGPNTTISHKEASGLAALAFAADLVSLGRAPIVVAGGADDIYERYFLVHDWFGVLSRDGAHPEGSRPFDRTRNGFVMGEGGFMCVLEHPEAAARRAARVYGEILGYGASGSSGPVNAWPTCKTPLVAAMRAALSDADVDAGAVSVVYASANSTVPLDRLEAEAIRDVFDARPVPVTSIKGAIGEFGGAGAAGVVAALACGRARVVPPTTGLVTRDPECPVSVANEPRPLAGPIALVNSFASGGTCYSLLVRLAPHAS